MEVEWDLKFADRGCRRWGRKGEVGFIPNPFLDASVYSLLSVPVSSGHAIFAVI